MTAAVHDLNEARSALNYALRYALLGWHVMPLTPGTKKPLGRLVRNGFHDATTDEAQIRSWWASEPTANIGIALKASGLVAVDIDPRNGGLETMESLEAQHGPVTSDVLAYTGGGGEHRVFAAALVEHLPGKLGPGVDLKADGYIAVEPSFAPLAEPPHKAPYAWETSSDPLDGVVPSTLPAWIRDMSRHTPAPTVPPAKVPAINAQRLHDAHEALQHIAADDRETWVSVGQAINNEMPGADGFALWDAWSQQSAKYDAQDQLRVWRSFKPRGLAGVGLNTVFKMAQDSGWKNQGAAAVAGEVSSHSAPRKGVPMLRLAELEASAAGATWSIKHVLPSNSVGMMFGAPGTFKSFIALDMGLHIARGMKWMGRKTVQAPVIYIAAEGGTGLWRRIKAWHLHRGLKWDDVPLYVVPVAVPMKSNAAAVVEAARQLGVQPGLVVVDTLSQTFEGEENSANDMAAYLTALGTTFRELWQCAVMVIHHSGHGATERPRGSSAIMGNTDFLFGVFRDEKQLLATVTCERQKDGELFKDELFELTSQSLGKDEDGDDVRSLTAHHVNPGAEAAAALVRQGAGRVNRMQQLIDLAHNGMPYQSLRHGFYDALGDDMKQEAKQKAFVRAWMEAKEAGLLEAKEGRVIVSALVDKSKDGAP